MMNLSLSRKPRSFAFLAAAILALLFALYTQHAWEDYYITYRSSKNLATGHGLVFNHGDKLHTFTSPLGVLLPAVARIMTGNSTAPGNSADPAALWIFRIMCITALGGAAALLAGLTRRLAWPGLATGFLVFLLITDAKVLDFTINGMETAFMLLFLAYAVWAHFTPGSRQWLHLGGAWAGLMWTRPDSFIYIGLIAGGCWLFTQPAKTGGTRRELLIMFLKAGLVTTALYGPWLAWAWWYYGSPIPHTIIAKGAVNGGGFNLIRLAGGIWQIPWQIWQGNTAAEGTFLPSYYMFPQWQAWTGYFGKGLATLTCLLWLLPKVRLETRVASLAYWGVIAYLSYVPYFPFPWYLPQTALLAFVAITGLLVPLWQNGAKYLRIGATGFAVLLLAGALMLTRGAARQIRVGQQLIEDGNRRVIGEWLHDHAEPGDTVFLEPLGYIGYFSGLKTYDWPGMSSREMPEAVHLLGDQWRDIIRYLEPTWLVLRAGADRDLPQFAPILASMSYDRIRDFDRRAEVEALDVPGRDLLTFDAHYVLYHRRSRLRHDTADYRIASPIPSSIRTIDGSRMRLVHAPGSLIVPRPPGARKLKVRFGFPDDASLEPDATNGAIFVIWLVDGKTRTKLSSRKLEPKLNPGDHGLKEITLDLPENRHPQDSFLVLETDAMGNASKDWTFWSEPQFE